MKKYTVLVEILEGYDEFWEEINAGGGTGVDDILCLVKDSLVNGGFDVSANGNVTITMVKFEDTRTRIPQ